MFGKYPKLFNQEDWQNMNFENRLEKYADLPISQIWEYQCIIHASFRNV